MRNWFAVALVCILVGACSPYMPPDDDPSSVATSHEALYACGPFSAITTQTYQDGNFPGISAQWVKRHRTPVGLLTDNTGYRFCTGALIAPDMVLTAAHCFHPLNGTACQAPNVPYSVTFDYASDGTYSPINILVSGIVENPWCATGMDFGIIRLVSPVPPERGLLAFGVTPNVGDSLVGYGLQYVTTGPVTAISSTSVEATYDIEKGFSGGPLLSTSGSLLGITNIAGSNCQNGGTPFLAMLRNSQTLRKEQAARLLTLLW